MHSFNSVAKIQCSMSGRIFVLRIQSSHPVLSEMSEMQNAAQELHWRVNLGVQQRRRQEYLTLHVEILPPCSVVSCLHLESGRTT